MERERKPQGTAKRKVIIDTDPGIDDAMAILLALSSPELDVIALTVVFGNVSCETAVKNAHRILAQVPEEVRRRVEVVPGEQRPLKREPRPHPTFVHGTDGLGNTWDPSESPVRLQEDDFGRAASYIVDQVRQFPNEISIITLGPLTNLSRALSLDPTIAPLFDRVVVMGGAVTCNGNVNPGAEANIVCDPHAADHVFTTTFAHPLTLVPLDVSMETLLHPEHLHELETLAPRLSSFLSHVSDFYARFHGTRYRKEPFMHLHDPSAVLFFTHPHLFRTRSGPLRVVPDGFAMGHIIQDVRDDWPGATPWSDSPSADVCVEVQAEEVRRLFLAQIESGEASMWPSA